MTTLSLAQLRRRREVESVELDSICGDWIVVLEPGWCWEEPGMHVRLFPPKDLNQEDLQSLIEPCSCVDCMFWILD